MILIDGVRLSGSCDDLTIRDLKNCLGPTDKPCYIKIPDDNSYCKPNCYIYFESKESATRFTKLDFVCSFTLMQHF